MVKKINEYWLGLSSAKQYLIWICSFCFITFLGVSSLVVISLHEILTSQIIYFASLCIFLFVSIFVIGILYLTIIWPTTKYTDSFKSKKIEKD